MTREWMTDGVREIRKRVCLTPRHIIKPGRKLFRNLALKAGFNCASQWLGSQSPNRAPD